MGTKNLLFLAAAGGAAWYFFLRPAAPAPAPAPPPVGAGSGAPAGVAPGSPAPSNTLAGVYAKMVAASGLPADARLGADGWNYYLNQVINPLGFTAPDPVSVFGVLLMGADRSAQFTAAEYWAVMGPAIKKSTGLSGFGFFGGMVQ
ncbi:MAG TPA: hypothetical protein VN794_07675 [Methylomirabilota bacterium]|nr:hypothetical protein [Methylomirabilota bacterium]